VEAFQLTLPGYFYTKEKKILCLRQALSCKLLSGQK
jgi:hypothetical protein